ncbi:MAG TPA: nuclear transport factor 2 family protein [Chloroflexota bacterium]
MGSGASQGEIRSYEDRRFEAMVAADQPALERLLGDDLVYTHSSASVDTKASLIEGIGSGRFSYRKIERPREEIRLYGDSAVVAGQARIELGGANPRVLNLRYLDVWVNGPNGWQMVAWQSTPIPG